MRVKSYIVRVNILIFLVVVCILFSTISAQGKPTQLFDKVVLLTEGSVEEVGIRLSFNIEENGEKALEKVLKDLNIENIDEIERAKDHGNESLNLSSKELSGNIIAVKGSTGSTVILNVTKRSEYNDVEELRNNIITSLKLTNKDIKYYYYIKAKIPSKDILYTNSKVMKFLKENYSTNIDTIDLGNSYSTVAYTKLFKPIKVGNNLIDFNYAVATYDSGNYIYLGTPILMIPY